MFGEWDDFLSKREYEKEIPQLRELKPKVPLPRIIQSVCDEFRCSEEQVKIRGRKNNKVLAIAMYLARDLNGISEGSWYVFRWYIRGSNYHEL